MFYLKQSGIWKWEFGIQLVNERIEIVGVQSDVL